MTEPTDADRYPTLTEDGRRMLEHLREHEAAPIYRNQSGNRLTAADIEDVAAFETEILATPFAWRPETPPDWLPAFVGRTLSDVPFFRARGAAPDKFTDLPTTSRADLAADIAPFVPDGIAIDRLINFKTTGTTGHPLLVPSHPAVAACYLPFLKRALGRFGVTLSYGRGQVGVILLGHQRQCFTYVSVTPSMDESGLAKINLHPNDWRDPADRARYLDAMSPELITGDPISFAALLELPVTTRPKALASVAMALSLGLRDALENRFACPVLDIYSMNEVGPIAVFDRAAGGHVLLQPGLYVEIVDEAGQLVPPGTRGEVTVTGGFNFCLPLLRYRTGDFAAIAPGDDAPVLIGLEGRKPVRFRTAAGEWLNNVDVTHALHGLPLSQYGFHQDASGALSLRLAGDAAAHADAALRALKPLFGDQRIMVEALVAEDKVLQYTSGIDTATA